MIRVKYFAFDQMNVKLKCQYRQLQYFKETHNVCHNKKNSSKCSDGMIMSFMSSEFKFKR